MSSLLPQGHPVLRQLAIESVFEYYDAPVLFVARNELGYPFFALAVDEIEGVTHYLFVPMSEERLAAVRTGLVTLRDAFGRPETPYVFQVRLIPSQESAEVDELAVDEIRTDWLPEAGEALRESLETARSFSLEGLQQSAVRENRHLVALEVDPPEAILRTELPLRFGGPILTEFQELADSLANESDFVLVQLQAASFVVILSPLVGNRLFGVPSPALNQISDLLGAAASDEFGNYLASLSSRRKVHVRDFFTALSDAGTGVTLSSASPSGGMRSTSLSLDRVRGGLQILRASSELEGEILHVTGYLMAINHPKRTFSVRESAPTGNRKRPRRVSGKFDPSINIEGIASGQTVLYQFSILRESEAADFDETEIKYSHRMLEMSLVTGEPEAPEDLESG